jgi:NAD(P)-dependent dehydrogenase (short-subunit alcohol dehydrogenase family)
MGMLEGNVTLITGGGSGLGRVIVERFVKEGARVAVLERSAEKVAALRGAFGSDVIAIEGNVSLPADNERAVAAVLEGFGRLDTFIGNAGVFDFGQRVEAMSLDELALAFDQLFAVNVKGYLLGARAALPALRESSGSIILTLSNAATLAGGGTLYTASKHAGLGIVRALAFELQGEVRVNAVSPGGMQTELAGLDALGQQGRTFGEFIDARGGPDVVAADFGWKFFPQAEDYVLGYVTLASSEARRTTGANFEMHGMVPALQRAPTHVSTSDHG